MSSADRLLAFSLRRDSSSTSTPGSAEGGLPDSTTTLADYNENGTSSSNGSGSGNSGAGGSSGNGEADAAGDTSDTANTANTANTETASLSSSEAGHVQDFETVAAAQVTGELDQLRQDVEDQLVAVLRDQVGDMLAGAVSRSYGGNAESLDELGGELEQMALDQVGELASTEAVRPFIEAVDVAAAMAETLEEEFRAIRQTIVDGFGDTFERMNADMAEEVGRLESSIEAYEEQLLNSELSLTARKTAEEAIRTLNEEILAAQLTFKEDLAEGLRDIVNGSTDLYVMSLHEARYLVDEFLRTEEDEIQLPWMEIVEEDDTDD